MFPHLPIALNFDGGLLWERLSSPGPEFWSALMTTVYVAVIAQIVGVLLGLLAAFGTASRVGPVRFVTYLYILIFRGTPVIVQIFFVYYGANLFLGFDLFPRTVDFLGIGINGAVLAGTIALAVNEGAYMAEIIRAGIDSIDHGQTEAAKSLGMPHRLAMRRIILPQAARVIVPPLGNEFNNMLKTTSLLAFIGVSELFQNAQVVYSTNFKPVEIFTAVALWYLLLTTIWSLIQVQIERRLHVSERADGLEEGWVERVLGFQGAPRGVR
jgi:polar amino acid transport system permease protein